MAKWSHQLGWHGEICSVGFWWEGFCGRLFSSIATSKSEVLFVVCQRCMWTGHSFSGDWRTHWTTFGRSEAIWAALPPQFCETWKVATDVGVGQLEGALLEHATHACSLYVSVGLWGWCAPETCADCIRHVGYWWEVCKIMECYITEELCIVSWQEAAAHLAGQDVAGSVELEWPQSRSWHSAACRWVRHKLLFGSHHIFLFWAWRGVAVVWQKSCSEQDVVSGRWRRFGDGRRVSIWVLAWCARTGQLVWITVTQHVWWNATLGTAWLDWWNKEAQKGGGWWAACAEELHYQVACNTLG